MWFDFYMILWYNIIGLWWNGRHARFRFWWDLLLVWVRLSSAPPVYFYFLTNHILLWYNNIGYTWGCGGMADALGWGPSEEYPHMSSTLIIPTNITGIWDFPISFYKLWGKIYKSQVPTPLKIPSFLLNEISLYVSPWRFSTKNIF